MKKPLFILLAFCLTLAACNKKAFLNKLVGEWKLDTYLDDGNNRTLYFDTTWRAYTLTIAEDNRYRIDWDQLILNPDSTLLVDTLGYDSVAMVYDIDSTMLYFIDTTTIKHMETGIWDLINSDEDLQLRNDTTNRVEMHRILTLDKENLKLRKGNEEKYFKH